MTTTMSTYTSYLSVNRDMKASLNRVASQGAVSTETKYYEDNIGKVKSVDDLLGNYRLYSYAMKAYGLEDMTYAKAFMKKVLESDLSDSSSFANSLSDTRYAKFAAAFNFGTTTETAQTSVQEDNLTTAYKDSFDQEQTDIKAANATYASGIDSITSVDDLLSNSDLRTYVLTAYGIDPTTTSNTYLKQVLTSDLSDSDSFANQTVTTDDDGNKDNRFLQLAEAFNFNTDGSVNGSIQTDDQKALTQDSYVYNKSTYPSDLAAEANQDYYERKISTITNVDDLVADSHLLAYVKTAFGISTEFPSTVKAILTSDPDDSNSAAAIMGYSDVPSYFNFQSDGTLADGDSVQDATQLADTNSAYKTAFQENETSDIDDAVSNYETRIKTVTSLDDFLTSNAKDDVDGNDKMTEIWDVALRAYGIDPDEVSTNQLRKILTSDTTDSKSYANKSGDERFVNLANAFNFDSDGKLEEPILAQSQSVTENYVSEYETQKTKYLTGTAKKTAQTAAETEATYFQTQMQTITTAKQFLSDSRLVDFVLTAKGIDPKSVKSDDLKKMFSSDLSDPNSFVNQQSDTTYAEIVSSFNFDKDGNITEDAIGSAQQRGEVLQTVNNYYQQSLEEQEGDTNEGVRLALYFQRMAPDITSAYQILGDTALFSFFTTSYNLSSYISNMDVDKQADLVNKYIDISKLSDPDYVEKMEKRFTALYDSANKTTTSAAETILSGSSSISSDTLLAVAQLSSK